MAYLPSFEYDIFISYAHVDNLVPRGGGRGWVDRFQEELELELSRRLGRVGAAKIWWDDSLDGSQVFDTTIQQTINGAGLFLALTSAGYLASQYCRKELDWFYRKTEKDPVGRLLGDRSRVFNVLIDNVPHESWPPEYGGTSGYFFYDEVVDRPMRHKVRAFEIQLKKLVDVVETMFKAVKGAPPPEEKKFTVFIADTADSLKNVRSRVSAELQLKGVSIVDRIPPPYEAQKHEALVIEKVKSADLCLHLLDQVPGRGIDDQPEKSYLERQAEISLEYAKAQFVWTPTDLQIDQVDDDSHRALLKRLEAGPGTNGGDPKRAHKYRFVRDLSSAVSHDLLERIEQLKQEQAMPEPSANAALAALVDTHFKDQQYVMEMSRFLLDNNILPLINREEDSPQKNLQSFESHLRQASLLIIIFGAVPPEWVRERLGEALKFAVTQNCPLRACGVYLAPPRKNESDMQFNRSFLPVELLDNTDRFNPQSLAPLLAKIQVGV